MSVAGPLRVGLTGGVASGKSAVCARLATHGIAIIDADAAARDVVAPGQPALDAVVARFGPQVLDAEGALDRRKLRVLVFADPASRLDLEAIVHPRVLERMRAQAQCAEGAYCVLAIPLLVENAKHYDWLDVIVVIDVAESVQLQRLLERDGIDIHLAQKIQDAQSGRAQRLAIADHVLDNHGSLAELAEATDQLHLRLLTRAAAAAGR